MNLKTKEQYAALDLTLSGSFTFQVSNGQNTSELPNILWIVSEDNSAFFTGCYGNSFATTPNIERLAGEGFLSTH